MTGLGLVQPCQSLCRTVDHERDETQVTSVEEQGVTTLVAGLDTGRGIALLFSRVGKFLIGFYLWDGLVGIGDKLLTEIYDPLLDEISDSLRGIKFMYKKICCNVTIYRPGLDPPQTRSVR